MRGRSFLLSLFGLFISVVQVLSAQQLPGPTPSVATPNESPDNVPPGFAPTPGPATLNAPALNPSTTANSSFLPDTANSTKFYTITASLRAEYDDNIYTSRHNKVGSFVGEFSPSILVNFNSESSTFSARYTYGLDYYANRSGQPIDQSHELLLHFTHQFNDRFSLDLRDQFGHYTEPDLLNGVGTPFRNGAYFINTFTGDLEAQWTPVFGTSTNYSNIAILYEESDIATFQNYDENTVTHDFRFALLPKYNFTIGGIFDNLDYFESNRGYTNYTGDVGVDWQALPNLSASVRIGATLTTSDSVGDSASPYASATVEWRLGKRSDVNFSYLHNVVPTDVFDSVGQEADRFTLRVNYDITARLTAHLAGTYTHSDYTSDLLQDGTPSFTEEDIGVDAGAEYRVNDNFSFEAGYLLSDISSQEDFRDYTRNQVYLGIRGTY
jgi:hypothetical protein